MELKLFLRVPYPVAKKRREERGGYVTRLAPSTPGPPSKSAGGNEDHDDDEDAKGGGDAHDEHQYDERGSDTGKHGQDIGDDSAGRNEERSGEGNSDNEGWWIDPPFYFQEVVWRHYIEDHAFLFEKGDVEGKFEEGVLKREGIEVFQLDPVVTSSTSEWEGVARRDPSQHPCNDEGEVEREGEDEEGGEGDGLVRNSSEEAFEGRNEEREQENMLRTLNWAVTLVLETLRRKMEDGSSHS